MQHFPIPPLAIYTENFPYMSTQSCSILRVDNIGRLLVDAGDSAFTTLGKCTNESGTGLISYDETSYSDLDIIIVAPGSSLVVSGFHAFGNVQAVVELVTSKKEIIGAVVENAPNYDFKFPEPIIITETVTLRIKSLRKKQGEASGRIFARLV